MNHRNSLSLWKLNRFAHMDAKPKIYDDAEMQHLLTQEKANQNEDSSSQNADSEISVLPSERIVKQRHNSGKGQAPGKADSSGQGPSHRLKPNHDDSWYAQREQQRIESYLRTIKDLPTIDWVYDATKEIDRKANLHMELESSYLGFLWKAYDASQGWIVVFVAGILTALFSGFIDIGTEWISYMRFGYCQHGFWLSRTVCCLEHSLDSECTAWVDWGDLFYSSTQTGDYINYFFFVLVSIIPAGLCAWIIQVFCPSAAGSGIPEVKVILGGFVVKGYLSAWTLFIKCIGLVMSVGSGLNVGKEGPMIHVASCCGNILCGMFPKYANNQAKRREVIAATAAAGVSAAFSAPIGGVLFSLEEASSFFPHKTMLRSFLSASTAAVVIRYINPLHSFKMVLYEVHYHTPWYWFEMPFFIFLGVCGGLLGALYIKLNVYICQKRKSTFVSNYPVSEVAANIIVTSLICYYSPLLRINSAELIGKLFSECSETFGDDELSFICNRGSLWKALGGLTFAFIVKFTLTVITIGTKIPAGLLIPSLAIGSCFGRIIGILVETMYYENPKSFYFSECIQSGCITPGVYAMVGAAATLGGVSRTTVSIAVIMFELTGGLAFMVPIMLAVLTSKWVGDSITEGIYDENITNAGYPYIDPKKEVMIPTPCSFLLQGKDLYACQMEGDTLTTLDDMTKKFMVHGFPVVTNMKEMSIVGYVSRAKLKRSIENALKLGFSLQTECVFDRKGPSTNSTQSPPRHSNVDKSSESSSFLDLSYILDPAPTIVTDGASIGQLFTIFQKLGIRLALVLRSGRLVGVISKKDIISMVEGPARHFLEDEFYED